MRAHSVMHTPEEEQTQTRIHADWLREPCLPYNLRRQHGPSPFQIDHMVQTLKTKQTCWLHQCTVHRVRLVFSSPLTGSICTDSRSTPQTWLGFYSFLRPVILQKCIREEVLPPFSAPCSVSECSPLFVKQIYSLFGVITACFRSNHWDFFAIIFLCFTVFPCLINLQTNNKTRKPH